MRGREGRGGQLHHRQHRALWLLELQLHPEAGLRLIDTLLRFSETHSDKMAIALSPADARRIVGSGRMAVFIGCESGFDHEGDPDVLDAFYRLGLRSVQFATQTGFNSFTDSALAPIQGGEKPDHFGGINDHGRKLVAQMNDLGILIDIAHGTEAVQSATDPGEPGAGGGQPRNRESGFGRGIDR